MHIGNVRAWVSIFYLNSESSSLYYAARHATGVVAVGMLTSLAPYAFVVVAETLALAAGALYFFFVSTIY